MSLVERLNVPEKFRPFVNDYKVNLFEIAYLGEEKVKKFKSDFRIVADYFVQKQKTGDYVPSAEQINHVQETLSLLSVMTGDRRFEEAINAEDEREDVKEADTMCEVLDRLIAKGKAEGKAEGRAEGKAEGKAEGEVLKAKEMAISLYEQGISVEIIAKAAKVDIATIEKWVGELPA